MDSIGKRLKNAFFKIFTFGKIDIDKEEKRRERLLMVLLFMQKTSVGDWQFIRNVKVVKDTIYHRVEDGYDFISDGFCGVMYLPRYKIDDTKEPIKIYETWPYFLKLDSNKGFVGFYSGDDNVFCKGKIVAIVNSEIIIEEIARGKTDVDTDLLGFFDSLRVCFNKKK